MGVGVKVAVAVAVGVGVIVEMGVFVGSAEGTQDVASPSCRASTACPTVCPFDRLRVRGGCCGA